MCRICSAIFKNIAEYNRIKMSQINIFSIFSFLGDVLSKPIGIDLIKVILDVMKTHIDDLVTCLNCCFFMVCLSLKDLSRKTYSTHFIFCGTLYLRR